MAKYADMSCETITEGLKVIREQASSPDATYADIAYLRLVEAIIEGEGFNFMTTSESYDLRKSDMRELLKELLYAIETERITDRHTHTDIVTETLENILGNLVC